MAIEITALCIALIVVTCLLVIALGYIFSCVIFDMKNYKSKKCVLMDIEKDLSQLDISIRTYSRELYYLRTKGDENGK